MSAKDDYCYRFYTDARLFALGFAPAEIYDLHRISRRLRRWFERLCNEDINEDENGITSRTFPVGISGVAYCNRRIPNQERGAKRQLERMFARYASPKEPSYYIQRDPRGVALYVFPPGKRPRDPSSDYSTHGIPVD